MSDFETLPIGTRARLERLERAAQQALEALLTPSGAQACSTCQEGPENEYCCRREMWSAVDALRAALAQQAEPLNLSDPAIQKRLAAQWGYVPAAAQAEPVAWRCACGANLYLDEYGHPASRAAPRYGKPQQAEPVAMEQPDPRRALDELARIDGELGLFDAPPRCSNCASLEAQHAELDDMLVAMEHAVAQAAAVERKACADICDAHASCEGIAQRCAADIRARGQA